MPNLLQPPNICAQPLNLVIQVIPPLAHLNADLGIVGLGCSDIETISVRHHDNRELNTHTCGCIRLHCENNSMTLSI